MRRSVVLAFLLLNPAQAEPGLEISEATARNPSTPRKLQGGQSRPLTAAQISRMLARLPKLPSEPTRPTTSLQLAPPTTLLNGDFPEKSEPPPSLPAEALQVVAHTPEGEVELANRITVSFNQPVDSQTAPAAKIVPPLRGQWRWLGDQTMIFEPDHPFPMATDYQVEVAGSTWKFSTPPPNLTFCQPKGEAVGLRPLLYLEFNQAVAAENLLAASSLDGVALRIATSEELAAQPELKHRADRARAGCWVALIPTEQLAKGKNYHFQIAPGLRSEEGSRSTPTSLAFDFSTHSELKVVEHSQGEGQRWYGGGGWFKISLNNELDRAGSPSDIVTVTPRLGGQKTVLRKRHIYISGHPLRNQTYSVQISPQLRDRFGQRLGAVPPIEFAGKGEAPDFDLDGSSMQSLPDGKLRFTSLNHRVVTARAYAVTEADWKDDKNRHWQAIPGKDRLIWKTELNVEGKLDERRHYQIDLNPAFEKSSMMMVDFEVDEATSSEYETGKRVWVQRSQIGVNVASDGQNLQVWVTRLATGEPIAGATVASDDQGAITDELGVANLKGNPTRLKVISGKDHLFVPASGLGWDDQFSRYADWISLKPDLRAYIADDRHIYRPGESVKIKGWVRLQSPLLEQPLALPGLSKVYYKLENFSRKLLARGEVKLSPAGGIHFEMKIPETADPGELRLTLTSDGKEDVVGYHQVTIQEFRRPEFEVETNPDADEVVLQEQGIVRAFAHYFAGGNLGNAEVKWKVDSESTTYQPAGWDGYTFQSWRPWWESSSWWQPSQLESDGKTFAGRTDAQGKCSLALEFPRMDEPRPRQVKVEATVNDVNRQVVSGRTNLLVHPANCYVGLKGAAPFVKVGEPLKYEVVVTDLKGNSLPDRAVNLTLFRIEWDEDATESSGALKKPAGARQITSGRAPVCVEFPQNQGGVYRLEARIQDDSGRINCSDLTSWAEGPNPQPRPRRNEIQPLTLVPNQKNYQPGEVAEILVQPSFGRGYALATVTREGLSRYQLLPLPKGAGVLQIPILEGDIPNAKVTVQAVGCDELGNPVESKGEFDVKVSTDSRRLNVQVSMRQSQASPGQTNQVDVRVTDPAGKPARNAEVALLGVDEAILSLSESIFENPLDYFYSERWGMPDFYGMRDWVALRPELDPVQLPGPQIDSPEEYEERSSAGATNVTYYVPKGTREAFSGRHREQIQLRAKPAPLAFYEPQLLTDSEGQIHFPFRVGDTLTRFRVVALAAAEDRFFGKGESSLQAQQPLSIRPSPPRFLNQGDQCQLPVVVQNQGSQTTQVQLAIRSDRLQIIGPAGIGLEVPAGQSREVTFPVVADGCGTARIQALASDSLGQRDATEFEVPIQQPETTEHIASYGTLDEGARRHPVRLPAGAIPGRSELEFSASSTALQELSDADSYLRDYPYGCSEQIASRILGVLASRPLHNAFGNSQEPESLDADLRQLLGLQNSDGGWDFWNRSDHSVPIVGLHVTHALVRANQSGVKVEKNNLNLALDYVRGIRDGQGLEDLVPDERRTLRSYAISVLERSGEPQSHEAHRFLVEAGGASQIPLEGLGWLIPSLRGDGELENVLKFLEQHSEETASSAHFGALTREGNQVVLSSAHRADCVILEALARVKPEHRLIPKLVRGLLDARTQGRWYNTQENCFALLAFSEYFTRFESVVPDFKANLWLDKTHMAQQNFRGRSKTSQEVKIPLSTVQKAPDLIVQKNGSGRLHYRLGLTYVPDPAQLTARNAGITVDRTYEALDKPEDVSRDGNGVWHIKAGANVKVTLRMVAPGPRYHVALSDPLPAGLEVLNPELKTTSRSRERRQWWYEHESLRDRRVDIFSRFLNGGAYSYSYYARATTPGQYQVAPAHAEEMYHPETSGRSSAWRVQVEP